MEREIKFRMWNEIKTNTDFSKMFYDTDEVMECLKQQVNFNNGSSSLGYDHIEDGNAFMQFTGLKDKNGKEIYEGDIVLQKSYKPQEIWFEDGGFLIGKKEVSDKHLFKSLAETIEVIGNIYENPELLK